MTHSSPDPLSQSRKLLRAHRMSEARFQLADFLRTHPDSEQGWWLMSFAVTQPARKIECLVRILKMNPKHKKARAKLKALTRMSPPQTSKQAPERPPPSQTTTTSGGGVWSVAKKWRLYLMEIVVIILLGVGLVAVATMGYINYQDFADSQAMLFSSPVAAVKLPVITPFLLPPTWTPMPASPPTATHPPAPTVTETPLSPSVTVYTPVSLILTNTPRPKVIGGSVSGRPLEVYTFGNGERQVMIVAGIHGGYEWNTIALADQLIEHINEHPEIIPNDVTLYILRNMNPDGDGRAHSVDGRVNDRGVDLNRNFPENWQAEWDLDGCWIYRPTTGGSGPGSEPETRAVMNFLSSHHVQALISYHSAAMGIFPGGEPWEASSIKLAQALSKVTQYPYPPIDTGCLYTGTLADYAVSLGIAAVDMELRDHRHTDFSQNLKALNVLLNWQR